MSKRNKSLIALLLVLCVGLVGLTIAYFSNLTSIENEFNTKEYGTTYTEEFVSPDNWLPGDTTNKTVTVTNSGQVDEAVRISLSEKWVAKDGTILSGLIDSNGNLTDEEENSEHAAIINFSDNGDFTYSNGYYYYNYRLAPNETTSSLIDSVTFNSKVKNSDDCVTNDNNGVKTITCNTTESGYDGATYTLTFNIETIQYNKYKEAWNLNNSVEISSIKKYPCDSYDIGEIITYRNEEYYVLKYSPRTENYIVLLKKEPLSSQEVYKYGNNYVNEIGEYPYYESDTCNENNQIGCSTSYDTSDVKKVVDNWSSNFSGDLVEINGYSARIIGEEDINYEKHVSPSDISYTLDAPSFILSNQLSWTTLKVDDSSSQVFNISYGILPSNIYYKSLIRPIINLKKTAIECGCFVNDNEYSTYNMGQKIIYNDEEYYVLEDSMSNKKYVTLLKSNPFTADEVNSYGINYISIDGEYPYYESDNCNENNQEGCNTSYDMSNVKKLIDKWSIGFDENLINYKGYKSRLINGSEITEILGFEYDYYNPSVGAIYKSGSGTPSWAIINNKPYWSMANNGNYGYSQQTISNNISYENVYINQYIRPVINLKKCALENNCPLANSCSSNTSIIDDEIDNTEEDSICEINNFNYISYTIGDSINYKNQKYFVIDNSDSEQNYVTLLKAEPLNYFEATKYSNGYYVYNWNNIGITRFDESVSNYENSNIKNIVDNWSSKYNNLVKVNGYKSRLITMNELLDNLKYEYSMRGTSLGYYPTELTPNWAYLDGYSYWTMSPYEDSDNSIYVTSGTIGRDYVTSYNAIRPVINLKKCAIDND